MGWRKFVVENTLEEALTDEVLEDFLKIKKDIQFYAWDEENLSHEELLEELRGWLFNEDHMEHMGNWLYEKKVHKIFKKHKITGYVIFSEDGDYCGNSGFKFVDGDLVSQELKLTFAEK